MTRTEIAAKITTILVDDFEIDEALLKEDAHMQKDLQIDSLDFVDIIVSLHEVFGFKIPAEDLKKMHTLGDLYDYIEAHVA